LNINRHTMCENSCLTMKYDVSSSNDGEANDQYRTGEYCLSASHRRLTRTSPETGVALAVDDTHQHTDQGEPG
ncbi:hypothetical protein JTZ10_22875, partial [Gordonia rubripertincta]